MRTSIRHRDAHYASVGRPSCEWWRPWFAAISVFLAALPLNAGVELSTGTVVEFATVEDGRRVLGEPDAFIQAMSQFDRCVRMKTTRLVTEPELLQYLASQVRAWSSSEQSKLSSIVDSIRGKLAGFHLSFPATIPMIKTTGSEEGGAAYCRGGCIIFPQNFLSQSTQLLQDNVIHELFHIFSSHKPQLRRVLYSVVGYVECGEVTLPESLQSLRITNPDAFQNCYAIRLHAEDRTFLGLPVVYSRTAYNGSGDLFSYLQWMLLELELRDGKYVPVCKANGQPQPVPDVNLTDYTAQIGADSRMPIHPEEILAEYFVLVVNQARVASPRIAHLLRAALFNPQRRPGWVPAGWYNGTLAAEGNAPYLIEMSSDLVNWQDHDLVQPRDDRLALMDRQAWLADTRFYRAKRIEARPIAPGSTNAMVWIEPGSFTMGSPPTETGRYSAEGPLTQLSITHGFWLGEHEVTQAEYQALVGPDLDLKSVEAHLPMAKLSWMDATNYCALLTEQVRSAGHLPAGYIYRLPTEAEWEYACRAGTTTPFHFGNDPDQVSLYAYAWFEDNSGNRLHPVGMKIPNTWGLHDMLGNVAEWCWDRWSERLPGGQVVNYQGATQGSKRAQRGGNWQATPRRCRSASREGGDPDQPSAGFRLALAPPLT